MTSIHRDIPINATAESVWDAVADFGAVHRRLAPGFVIDARMEDNARLVTFANGTTARELLVDCDPVRCRLVYAVVSERVQHYSAAVQVVSDGEGRCRLLWTVDLLPDAVAPYVSGQMDQAVVLMQATLERAA